MVGKKALKDSFADFLEDPTRENLRKLLKENLGENRRMEFKQEWLPSDKLAKHLLGFANSGPGCLIFGVAETEDALLDPVGLGNTMDKADIENKLRKYLPSILLDQIQTFDFFYDSSEYEKLVGKKFQVLIVDYRPEYIPFMAIKNTDKLNNTTVYCRRDGLTAPASYDELQRIINNRLETGHSSRTEITSKDHLNQLETLYKEIPSGLIASLHREAILGRSVARNGETYREFVERTIERKKRVIEVEFGIRPRDRS